MAWYLDGRVSAVLGTHTHVPTADERILPKGTAALTDVGDDRPVRGDHRLQAAAGAGAVSLRDAARLRDGHRRRRAVRRPRRGRRADRPRALDPPHPTSRRRAREGAAGCGRRARTAEPRTPAPVSVLITARDEAEQLPGALASVAGWAGEVVVVVDPRTTDATRELAARGRRARPRAPLRVQRRPVQLGARPVQHAWVLVLDADERVTTELRDAITARCAARAGGLLGAPRQPRVRPAPALRRLGWRPGRPPARPASGPAFDERSVHGAVAGGIGGASQGCPRAPHPALARPVPAEAATTTPRAARPTCWRPGRSRPWPGPACTRRGGSCAGWCCASASWTAGPGCWSLSSAPGGRSSSGCAPGRPRRRRARVRRTGVDSLPGRLLVDLPNWLGDFVHTLPALQALLAANRCGRDDAARSAVPRAAGERARCPGGGAAPRRRLALGPTPCGSAASTSP